MKNGKKILSQKGFALTIDRLALEIIESYENLSEIILIGIQERGVMLAERLMSRLKILNKKNIPTFGKLDITFYRDDYRHSEKLLKASSTEMDFEVEGKKVVLVDDVLYTGRTVHAAISALQDFGRPERLELLCLVDRRFNRHLPIVPDYTGITVDALDEAYVKVEWSDIEKEDKVLLFSGTNIKP